MIRLKVLELFSISSQRSISKLTEVFVHPRYSVVRSENDGLEEKLMEQIKEYSSKLDEETSEVLELSLSHNISAENKLLYWEGVEYYRSALGQGLVLSSITYQNRIIYNSSLMNGRICFFIIKAGRIKSKISIQMV